MILLCQEELEVVVLEIKKCENCLYYSGGHCLRYPPRVIGVLWKEDYKSNTMPDSWDFGEDTIRIESLFPSVSSDDWCGEWKEKGN